MALKTGFYPSVQHHRACNINLLRRTPRVCGRIAYSHRRGGRPLAAPAQEPTTSARQRRRPIGLDVSEPELSNDWHLWPVGCVAGMDRAAPGSIRRFGLSASAEPCPRPP